ncbi:MBL fold metallo-hydrolase [Devosia sp.]|uniref:MBL fold metallo-hydrolase n=1 Tax=Devosia sp. TaxID=1871048 RepID=UPI001ACAD461|nr:ribonuclease Z [Devosia sp.]MBN9334446.1 ribonuclease Z [Devosia sp.]
MNGLELTVVGAGTILPNPGLAPACHLLRVGDATYIFDLGPGSLQRLAASGVDYKSIDLLFISHLHPDHVLDIVTLLQANNATPGWERTRPLRLVGCYGLESFVERLLTVFRDAVPESYLLEFVELAVGRHQIEGVLVEVALTGHTSNSLAFRLETAAGIFVYGGDAADIPAMVDIARGADLFLCECSFLAPFETDDHLTALSAARIAQSAGVRHLILTHTYPDTDHALAAAQAATEFKGRLTLAIDGTVVTC